MNKKRFAKLHELRKTGKTFKKSSFTILNSFWENYLATQKSLKYIQDNNVYRAKVPHGVAQSTLLFSLFTDDNKELYRFNNENNGSVRWIKKSKQNTNKQMNKQQRFQNHQIEKLLLKNNFNNNKDYDLLDDFNF